MRFSVELPETIVHQLHLDGPDGEARAVEMFALEGYRRGDLSRGEVSSLLGMELNETAKFLKENGCSIGLSIGEYEVESARLREFLRR